MSLKKIYVIYITYTIANSTKIIMSMVVGTETRGRYVPPHKRGKDSPLTEVSEFTYKSRNFRQSGTRLEMSPSQEGRVDSTEIVKRKRRRDLSQRSQFNTKRESPTRESPKDIREIEVPIAVAPPIVESPSTTDFLNQGDIIEKGLM